jgi:formylglycine-generating enzyme required for sulfatase activity
MKKNIRVVIIAILTIITLISLLGCKATLKEVETSDAADATDKTNDITAFSFSNLNPALSSTVVATISGTKITARVPEGTDVTALVATFTTNGLSVEVEGIEQDSGVTPNDFSSDVTYTVTAVDETTQDYTVSVVVVLDSAKAITAFSFTDANAELSSTITAAISGTTITVSVPYGTDVTALVATYTTTGSTVEVNSTAQTSGTTSNDFSSHLIYTVTANDGTTQDYAVVVIEESDVSITAFSFTDANPELSSTVTASINGTAITATMPIGTNVTALEATFTTTGSSVTVDSTPQESGITTNDFSSDVIYTVTAEDDTTMDYTVTVTVPLDSAKDITAFSFTDANPELSSTVNATINGTTIMAAVPYGTDVTALEATFTTTGLSVAVDSTPQVSGSTTNDFSSDVTYTVTAEDDTTKDYTVTLSSVAGDPVNFSVGGIAFTMNFVPGGLTFLTGVDDSGPPGTVTDAYLVGQTEVTYELWNVVKTWATSNGYTFGNPGRQGGDFDATNDAVGSVQHPVTTVNWRDSMVWMNALTEYFNNQNGTSLTCVYYTDSNYSTPIRTSTDAGSTDGTPGSEDNPYIKASTTGNLNIANNTATGFRLLTSNEFKLAARYVDDTNSDGDIQDANEYYPGDYASGATADTTDAVATDLVAVYTDNSGFTTAVAKSKSANALNLYDISGNILEWVFDQSGSQRGSRGGQWFSDSFGLRLGSDTAFAEPFSESGWVGFRFARIP